MTTSTTAMPLEEKKKRTGLILENIHNLPSMPTTLKEILRLLSSERVSNNELTREIVKDQSLVLKILSIANSPFYGLQRKVTSIDFAVMVLGFSELQNIVWSLMMFELFKNKTDEYLDQNEFFAHSFLTGVLAKKVAEDLGYIDSGQAFVAGFVHDIGISIMHRYLHSNFVEICEMAKDSDLNLLDIEKEVTGLNHEEIGKMLLEKWNIPDTTCDAVLNHHNPSNSQSGNYLASIIHLSDYLIHEMLEGKFTWEKDLKLDEEIIQILKFNNREAVDDFINEYRITLIEQAESVGIKV